MENSSILLLCGGSSKRMGKPKGLLEKNGQYWLNIQINSLLKLGFKKVFLVLGDFFEQYKEKCNLVQNESVKIIFNSNFKAGQFSSIFAGVLHLFNDKNLDDLFILPIDCPCPDLNIWQSLQKEPFQASIPSYNLKGGHPIKIKAKLWNQILNLNPESDRLDFFIRKLNSGDKSYISVEDPKVIMNMNSSEDWERFR